MADAERRDMNLIDFAKTMSEKISEKEFVHHVNKVLILAVAVPPCAR
ncbi:hypothetical protein [Paracoccus beibuensis]|nr:hypothetical protein [Paracoccus beibuensis]